MLFTWVHDTTRWSVRKTAKPESDVSIDGISARHYDYDANGNRTMRSTSSATEICTYDAQDRLVACGATQYEYNAVGQLTSKTNTSTVETTSFDYDVFGNLRTVMLPDGRVVEYEVDGQNRRIGKRVDGVRQWGLLYQEQLTPVAQVDSHNATVSTFIYATRSNVPDYMVKGGQTYRFVVDHIGSVRSVINTATGVFAQQIEYDEFGEVVADSNPSFQPFGFGGGLYDADTGLVRFGARDYDAVVGRWMAKDPILFDGESSNLYLYAHADPINFGDPTGLSETSRKIACGYLQRNPGNPAQAWRDAQADRKTNHSQELADAEHYLYSCLVVSEDPYYWARQLLNTLGYHVAKLLGFGDEGTSKPTYDQFEMGICGAHDALFNRCKAVCEY